jgi:hypothetical protein
VSVETLDPTRTSITKLEALQADGIALSALGKERLKAARENAEYQASEADGRKKEARKRINKAIETYAAAQVAAIEAIDALVPTVTAAQDARVELERALAQGRVEGVASEYPPIPRKEEVLRRRAGTDAREVVRIAGNAIRGNW